MALGKFTEKEIRDSILKKIDPAIKKSRASHNKGCISIDDKIVLRIKIPNPHAQKYFGHKKAKRLAESLKLDHDEFNHLINCHLTGSGYYELLRIKVND